MTTFNDGGKVVADRDNLVPLIPIHKANHVNSEADANPVGSNMTWENPTLPLQKLVHRHTMHEAKPVEKMWIDLILELSQLHEHPKIRVEIEESWNVQSKQHPTRGMFAPMHLLRAINDVLGGKNRNAAGFIELCPSDIDGTKRFSDLIHLHLRKYQGTVERLVHSSMGIQLVKLLKTCLQIQTEFNQMNEVIGSDDPRHMQTIEMQWKSLLTIYRETLAFKERYYCLKRIFCNNAHVNAFSQHVSSMIEAIHRLLNEIRMIQCTGRQTLKRFVLQALMSWHVQIPDTVDAKKQRRSTSRRFSDMLVSVLNIESQFYHIQSFDESTSSSCCFDDASSLLNILSMVAASRLLYYRGEEPRLTSQHVAEEMMYYESNLHFYLARLQGIDACTCLHILVAPWSLQNQMASSPAADMKLALATAAAISPVVQVTRSKMNPFYSKSHYLDQILWFLTHLPLSIHDGIIPGEVEKLQSSMDVMKQYVELVPNVRSMMQCQVQAYFAFQARIHSRSTFAEYQAMVQEILLQQSCLTENLDGASTVPASLLTKDSKAALFVQSMTDGELYELHLMFQRLATKVHPRTEDTSLTLLEIILLSSIARSKYRWLKNVSALESMRQKAVSIDVVQAQLYLYHDLFMFTKHFAWLQKHIVQQLTLSPTGEEDGSGAAVVTLRKRWADLEASVLKMEFLRLQLCELVMENIQQITEVAMEKTMLKSLYQVASNQGPTVSSPVSSSSVAKDFSINPPSQPTLPMKTLLTTILAPIKSVLRKMSPHLRLYLLQSIVQTTVEVWLETILSKHCTISTPGGENLLRNDYAHMIQWCDEVQVDLALSSKEEEEEEEEEEDSSSSVLLRDMDIFRRLECILELFKPHGNVSDERYHLPDAQGWLGLRTDGRLSAAARRSMLLAQTSLRTLIED